MIVGKLLVRLRKIGSVVKIGVLPYLLLHNYGKKNGSLKEGTGYVAVISVFVGGQLVSRFIPYLVAMAVDGKWSCETLQTGTGLLGGRSKGHQQESNLDDMIRVLWLQSKNFIMVQYA